jgi:methyltransferase (TIGR00027 family)
VKNARPSSSAQTVALARAHLNWIGVLDDPWAETMLRPPWAAVHRVLRQPLISRLGRNRSFAYLAARTRFYDAMVAGALDAGVRQVAVIGAGYDSRAWRLGRPGVEFFELDHPATQADKGQRAPAGGPRYIPAELGTEPLGPLLARAGFATGQATVFTVEGLTMYLTEAQVVALLQTLRDVGGVGSRLAVNFGVGFEGAESRRGRAKSRAGRGLLALGRESTKFTLAPDEAPRLLADTGWRTEALLVGPELAKRYLAGTDLPVERLNPKAFVVSAHRA